MTIDNDASWIIENNELLNVIWTLCLEIQGIKFTIANIHVYAPNEDNVDLFKNVWELLENVENSYIIIGGDFNLVLDIKMDKQGGRPVTHEKCKSNMI